MKSRIALLSMLLGLAASPVAFPQARDIPSAAPAPVAGTPEQQGKKLIDEMVEALGGQAWLDRKDSQVWGRTAQFFRGQPNGNVIEFTGWRRFPDSTQTGAERIGFLTDKSMILPGKKIDVVQIWTADNGYEVTYKGRTTLPKD